MLRCTRRAWSSGSAAAAKRAVLPLPVLLSAAEIERIIRTGLPAAEDLDVSVLRAGYEKRPLPQLTASLLLPYQHESTARHLRPGGTISGPSMFALSDAAFYACALAMTGAPLAVTTSLNINFLSKPAGHAALLCEARTMKAGSRLHVYECEIFALDDALAKRLQAHVRERSADAEIAATSASAIVRGFLKDGDGHNHEEALMLVAHATGTYSIPPRSTSKP